MKKRIQGITAAFFAAAGVLAASPAAVAKPIENNILPPLSTEVADSYASAIIQDNRSYKYINEHCFIGKESGTDSDFFICFTYIAHSTKTTYGGATEKEVCAIYNADRDENKAMWPEEDTDIIGRLVCAEPLPPVFLV